MSSSGKGWEWGENLRGWGGDGDDLLAAGRGWGRDCLPASLSNVDKTNMSSCLVKVDQTTAA